MRKRRPLTLSKNALATDILASGLSTDKNPPSEESRPRAHG
ncbi:hypothetical protein AA0120_g1792 [Alternaria tenuissima]|uniref:Uncharacterized protein n=1 Tax=Alternaria tenuissima TaxID=119927 RepID=A0A4Q4MHB7_9PLEO|nr:hypothetical protein AA0114_g6413 [Alternaria tenuissima]RYN99227.1 hypothetical protein AA0120_g1792 [Alternaria tenuissima]